MPDYQQGGIFNPARDIQFTGAVDLPAAPTASGVAIPTATSTTTLTNKTLTSPTITTGALTSPTITGTPVINTLKSAFSTTSTSNAFAADTYLAGSQIALPTGGWIAGSKYRCVFDLTKTGAGTAALAVTLRVGAAGTTSDAAILTFTFGAGTAAGDTGVFTVEAHFRTVGATTTAVMAGYCSCSHHLAATGLISTGASGFGVISVVSSGFDSTTANNFLGLSVNGGTSFVGSGNVVEAQYSGY
jgi:hypothetical protein